MSVNFSNSGSMMLNGSNHVLDSMYNEHTAMTIYGTLPRRKLQYNKNFINSNTNVLTNPTISQCFSMSSHQISAPSYSFINEFNQYSNPVPYSAIHKHNFSRRKGGKRRFNGKRNLLANSSASSSSRSSIVTSSSGIFSTNSNQSSGIISPPLISSENTSSAASSTDYTETISTDYENILSDELNELNFNGYQNFNYDEIPFDSNHFINQSESPLNIADVEYPSMETLQKFPSVPFVPDFRGNPVVYRCYQEQKKFYKQIYEQQFAAYAAVANAYKQRIQQQNQATSNSFQQSQEPQVDQNSRFSNSNQSYSIDTPNKQIPHQHLGLPPLPPPLFFPIAPFILPQDSYTVPYQDNFEDNNSCSKSAQSQSVNIQNLNIASSLSKEQIRDIMLDRMLNHKSLRCSPLVATTPVCRVTTSPIQSENPSMNTPKRNG